MVKSTSFALERTSLASLQAALARSMLREHSRLKKKLTRLESRMRREGVAIPQRRAGLPALIDNGLGNTRSLHASLAKVMRGKVMSPAEATQAVIRLGYKSNAKSLRYLVCHRLATLPQFERVARGKYRVR